MSQNRQKTNPHLLNILYVIQIMSIVYLFFIIMPGSISFAAPDSVNNIEADLVWAESDGNDFEIYYTYFSHNIWQPKVRLSNDHLNNIRPSISSGSDGSLWAVWSSLDGSESHLFYSYFDGTSWTGPVQISTGLSSNSTPSVFIDQDNIRWIVWTGFDGRDDEIYFTRWNGLDWDPPEMINRDDSMPDVLPVVGFNTEQSPYVQWLGYDGERYRSYVSKWTGTTWEDETIVENTDAYRFMEKNKADLIPDLPDYIGELSQASIHLRGVSEIQSIRFHDFQNMLSEKKNPSINSEEIHQSSAAEIIAIAFGDSITQGVPYVITPGDGRRVGGYEPDLEALLEKPSQKVKVLNYGVGGENTAYGLNRIDSVLSSQKAAFILFMEGTNDIFSFSHETTYANLRAIVDRILSYNITPILAELTPDIRVPQILMKDIPHTYNREIKKIANEKGIKMAIMYYTLFYDWKSLSVDGLHPNTQGYRQIAKIWFDTIKAPAVRTSDANAVGVTTAIVSGFINPNHFHTLYWFEYDYDTTYGSKSAVMDAGSGNTEISVSADLSRLKDNSTYHFRLAASNDYGNYAGDDQSFQTLQSQGSGSGRCFIATAAFGSPLEPGVVLLRAFRDKYLLQFEWGRAFVDFYYMNSPKIADIISKSNFVKLIVKTGLYPLIGFSYFMLNSSAGVKIIVFSLSIFLFLGLGIFIFHYRLKTS